MTLLAGFAVLLARYSGQEEVVVGTPIANRTRVETEELIGCFVNTLVMRVDAGGNPKFRELVQRVKQVALEGYAHQDVPFEKLVEELQPKRDLSRTALFQVLFVLQNAPVGEAKLGGLRLEEVEFDRKVAKFDLTVTMGETEEGLGGVVEYNTDLFEAGTMARLVGHWERLLEGIAEGGGEQRVWELALLGEGERRQVVEEWNETAGSYPREKTVVELIEEQVERTPEREAVVYEGQRLSYRGLNERANQLARRLQRWGVGPEELVGICMKRSMEMVVGILGVLKAGGAYVPLEPDYPRERLEYMVRDTGVRVVLTEERYRGVVEQEGLRVLSLDKEWSEVAGEASGPVRSGAGPENLAYVIYTSGSTGKPKGVMNTHEGLCNRLWWMQQEYGLGEEDGVLQKTPYSFDVSVWEFLWPLMSGARLVMARPEGHRDSRYLVEVIEQEQITTVHFVPSMLQVFVEERELQRCGSLRRVICSGEALSGELQGRFFGRMGAELHNLYGPTEAAIDVTYWACERGAGKSSVPIGRPINNLQIYILDRYMNPVPVGVNGELHIGGVGLARGYLNRGELTAEKFVENPFGKEGGARLYKTGDVARFRADGVIEYVGRMDQQVKVRGYRIELGEIEAVLMQHAEVSECVVLAREDEPGVKRLVAYVVGEKQAPPGLMELRNWVKERLPEYMVPAAFVALQAIPVTTNGKVDRGALPVPEATRPDLEQEYVAPRTPAEQTLARIWAEVLQLERVGVHDNFFELGGHSLLATQVTARIRDLLRLEVPLIKIFEFPVLAEFAGVLSQLQPLARKTAAAAIKHRNTVSREPLLAKLDQLSEQEIGELLNNTLAARENQG
jgi:amino acid adenylation domain-containing protein